MPLSATAQGPGQTAIPPPLVLRGFVVQYIPPSGSVVGSLSIRVTSTGGGGRALMGELVTVAVDARMGSNARQLFAPHSLLTLTLRAGSPGSILKGAGALRTVVASAPPQDPGTGSPPARVRPDSSTGPAQSGDGGNGGAASQPQSVGKDSGDHGSVQTHDGGSGDGGHGSGQGQSGSGSSNGHK